MFIYSYAYINSKVQWLLLTIVRAWPKSSKLPSCLPSILVFSDNLTKPNISHTTYNGEHGRIRLGIFVLCIYGLYKIILWWSWKNETLTIRSSLIQDAKPILLTKIILQLKKVKSVNGLLNTSWKPCRRRSCADAFRRASWPKSAGASTSGTTTFGFSGSFSG